MIDPEEWVDMYADYLYRYALSRVHDATTAEDLVQETFLAGLRGVSTFKEHVEVKYWLRGILRHKVVDYIRKQVRLEYTDEVEKYDERPSALRKYVGVTSIGVEKWTFDPAQYYENREFWEIFANCLRKLKDPLRSIYIIKELENESNEKICKEFNITPNNLWVIIHRARLQLKKCLNLKWKR